MVVGSYSLPPFLYMDKDDLTISGGISDEIVGLLANYYGFTFSHIPAGNWFAFYPNGTIGGSIAPVS